MKLVQRYISIEEKDAHHCMNHFLKIRDRDASAASDLLPATREHLHLIRSYPHIAIHAHIILYT